MAFWAYCAVPDMYHRRDMEYAASASSRSSVQP
jgi:hypothetical protein